MTDKIKLPEQIVFGLDIGTRSIVGTVGYMETSGFKVAAMVIKEHDTRCMLDGQIHDIGKVSEEIRYVKDKLEKIVDRPLKDVCIAAAGRVLKTITVKTDNEFDEETRINEEMIYSLDLVAVEKAHHEINESNSGINFYCVGYTPVKYYLNDFEISNLNGHKANKIGVELIGTFLPEEVVDGLYASVEEAGLEVANLTLEPIAAMQVAIPEQFRLLNIALVDVGAGTSDICITKDGSVAAYGMIPSAGDEITELIAKNYLVDFKTAEKIKLASGGKAKISFKDIMGLTNKIMPEDVRKLVSPLTARITGEVADRIKELNGGRSVSAVFVVGGGGKIPNFTAQLAHSLGLAEERVALRGKEVLKDIDFLCDNVKKDSLFVTPVGICINYYNRKNNFIFVNVNGERIKLYDNSHLTIVDAILQAGFPNDRLFPRRGKELVFTVNGKTRLVRGIMGEPAVIYRNKKETNINAPIEKNDEIVVKESTVGKNAKITVGQLEEYKNSVSFIVNGQNIICPKFAYVNGELKPESYKINEGDKVIMENYYTLGQLFKFLDIPIENKEVLVNNMSADENTPVYENFTVTYTDVTESYAESAVADEAVEEVEEEPSITVKVNGRDVIMTDKDKYTFVNVFDFYPFDLTKAGGTELVTTLNGENASFTEELKNGDIIELYWK